MGSSTSSFVVASVVFCGAGCSCGLVVVWGRGGRLSVPGPGRRPLGGRAGNRGGCGRESACPADWVSPMAGDGRLPGAGQAAAGCRRRRSARSIGWLPWGADLRSGPAQGLLGEAEGVLDVDVSQVGLPRAAGVCGGRSPTNDRSTSDLTGPSPHRAVSAGSNNVSERAVRHERNSPLKRHSCANGSCPAAALRIRRCRRRRGAEVPTAGHWLERRRLVLRPQAQWGGLSHADGVAGRPRTRQGD